MMTLMISCVSYENIMLRFMNCEQFVCEQVILIDLKGCNAETF